MRFLSIIIAFSLSLVIFGCGGAGNGGEGASSSSASLALTTDVVALAAGNTLSATVQLTSLSGAPVNGVRVTVDSIYQGVVLASYAANTNTTGRAVLNVPMTMVNSSRTISLVARSSGITPSNTVNVSVLAPALTATFPATSNMPAPAVAGNIVGLVLGGVTATFKSGSGEPVVGQVIRFTLVSQTDLTGEIWINGTLLNPGDFIDLLPATDNTGTTALNVSVFLASSPAAGGVNTVSFNYTVSTTYNSIAFTKQGDTMFTVTSP
jgi:hypothetical protein